MLRPNDFYDSITVYEDEIPLSQIINELGEREYSRKECKEILYALINDTLDEQLFPEEC